MRRRRSASGARPTGCRGGQGTLRVMSASVSRWLGTIMWIPAPERGRSPKQVLTWSIGRLNVSCGKPASTSGPVPVVEGC